MIIAMGCQSIKLAKPTAAINTNASTNVSSDAPKVQVPGKEIAIPVGGLTLADAISLSADPLASSEIQTVSKTDLRNAQKSTFVALSRQRDGAEAEVYYIPLLLVINDIAGNILVSSDDRIQMIDWRKTSLKTTAEAKSDDTRTFSVEGLVPRPGIYFTSTKDSGQILKIEDIFAKPVAGTLGVGDEAASIILLKRTSKTGLVEQFVLPATDEDDFSLDTFEAAIANSDEYAATNLVRLPIVVASLLAPTMQKSLQAEFERRRTLLDQSQQSAGFLRRQIPPALRPPISQLQRSRFSLPGLPRLPRTVPAIALP